MKKLSSKFKPVDYVVVNGRKVKCDSDVIYAVLECTKDIEDDYQCIIKKKSLEILNKWLTPLIYDGTLR